MKPQAMGSQEFFLALCRELGLSPTDSDEETILWAIYALKIDAGQAKGYEIQESDEE